MIPISIGSDLDNPRNARVSVCPSVGHYAIEDMEGTANIQRFLDDVLERLPEFELMRPFTPVSRDDLILPRHLPDTGRDSG